MSVNSTDAFSGPYTATGTAQSFPFTFTAASRDEVQVTANGIIVDPTSYTVTLNSDGTGAVNATLDAGVEVFVESNPDFQQSAQFSRFAPYFPDAINVHLDRSAIRDIALADRVSRTFVIPRRYQDAAGKFARISTAGGWELVDGVPGIAGAAANTRQSLAELKAAKITDVTSLYDGSTWFWTVGNYSATSAADLNVNVVQANGIALTAGAWVRQGANGVTFRQTGTGAVLRTAQAKAREIVNVDDFLAPGAVDQWGAFDRARTELLNRGGGILQLSERTYRIEGALELDTGSNEVSLIYQGKGLCTYVDQYGAGQPGVRIGKTQRLRNSGMSNIRLRAFAGAGANIEVGPQGFEGFVLDRVDLEQYNLDKRVWSAPSGNMFYLDATGYWKAAPGSVVSPVYIRAQDTTVNHNRIKIAGYNSYEKPFFDIQNEALATWLIGNQITAIFQNCRGGGMWFANAQGWELDFNFWDLNPDNGYVNDLVRAVANSGYESVNCDLRIKRNGSGMAGAARDVRLIGGQDFTINPMTPSGDIPRYDWGNKRVIVTGRVFNEENFNNRQLLLPDQSIFVNALSQNLNGDTIRVGGLASMERGTITAGGGFIQVKTTIPGTALVLTTLSGSSTEHSLTFAADGASFYPATPNFTSLGLASNPFSTVYANNGAIQASDERLKKWRGGLTAAEIAASAEISSEIGIYQFLDAVREKGEDARSHVGVKAQQVVAILRGHGLDPFRYAFVCYDKWDATEAVISPASDAEISSDGIVVREAQPEQIIAPAVQAGERYGIRYDELAMFLLAGQEARLSALERR